MAQRISAAKLAQSHRTVSSLVLGAGFCLTGVGTVMVGVLLPLFSQKWGLRDEAAGLLLFLQFFGSTLGAIVTSVNRVHSLIAGYGLLVACTGILTITGLRETFAAFFFYGLGLGLAMTATSLLVSERYDGDRAAKLERYNFAWSLGATAGPILFSLFLQRINLRSLFFSLMGMFFLILVSVIFLARKDTGSTQIDESRPAIRLSVGSLLPLLIMAMCSTGVEAALSGWLTTYSHRAGLSSLAGAALSTTLFWCGCMLSRFAFSTSLLARIGHGRVLLGSIWGVALTVTALIAAPNPSVIFIVSVLAGFCLGPLYPLLLSFLLERSQRGWIFAAGGVGASIFPWLTGLLSTQFGSLRLGLIAPCGAALLMITLRSMSIRHPAPRE